MRNKNLKFILINTLLVIIFSLLLLFTELVGIALSVHGPAYLMLILGIFIIFSLVVIWILFIKSIKQTTKKYSIALLKLGTLLFIMSVALIVLIEFFSSL